MANHGSQNPESSPNPGALVATDLGLPSRGGPAPAIAETIAGCRRRLRVIHIVQQLHIGGMEKLLVEFARHGDRTQFELQFLSLSTLGDVTKEIEACGWPVRALEEPPGLRLGLIWRLARLFRREKIDVVHTHNTKPQLYGAPAARLAGVRAVIQTRHGQPYQSSRRKLVGFRLAAHLTSRVVCVSEDSRELTARYGVSPRKLCTVWNGIDTARFAYHGPSPAGPVVTVARLSLEKDIATLVRAAALALATNPGFRLEIAGDGPCLPQLKQSAAELGVTEQVRFLGQTEDIPGLLARSSLFVLPSLTEGISLTLLEAMAVGLPVVATAVGGNPEVVRDGETGFLVPPGDAASLAGAMNRLLGQPALGQAMGRQGRARVEQEFDVGRMVRRYEALYRDCVFGPAGATV
jgi:sugar transferase (PEP-CTERM/EpsH1 system associated)